MKKYLILNNNMEIYAFMGKQKVGKNYVAEKLLIPLLNKHSFKNTIVMGFADQLKVNAIIKENLPYEKAFGDKDLKTRKILQKLGTEEGRDKFGQDIWIRYLDTWLKIYQERGIERVIVTDLRFKNEYDYLKSKNAKIIKVVAPNRQMKNLNINVDEEILKHDYLVNNDYNDDIENDLLKIVN